MRIGIMASRHSLFYSPLLACVSFLRDEGHEVPYSLLGPNQRSYSVLREGEVDIVQSSVASNWKPSELGIDPLPVHFAQINQRDGFFLVGQRPEPDFRWKQLEGKTLLADHGLQPLVMLKYAVRHNRADWDLIKIRDARTPDRMEAAFNSGVADYVHLQGPVVSGEIVALVGASVPPVAFSSLCCSRSYQKTEGYQTFLTAYARAREWVSAAPPEEVATLEAPFFPGIELEILSATIKRYQGLGCWKGSIEIPRNLYEQALNVFQDAGEIGWRHPYEDVVG